MSPVRLPVEECEECGGTGVRLESRFSLLLGSEVISEVTCECGGS